MLHLLLPLVPGDAVYVYSCSLSLLIGEFDGESNTSCDTLSDNKKRLNVALLQQHNTMDVVVTRNILLLYVRLVSLARGILFLFLALQ